MSLPTLVLGGKKLSCQKYMLPIDFASGVVNKSEYHWRGMGLVKTE